MRRLIPFTLLLALVNQSQALKLPDQSLYHYQCPSCVNLSKSTLSTSWLIEDKAMVPADVKPVISKRYYRKVTGQELKQGIELGVLAEGAIIRVTPVTPKQVSKNWQQKWAIQTGKQKKPLVDMVQSLSDEQEFKKQFDVGPALIFQLKQGLSNQRPYLVYEDENLDNTSQWQLSVYDKMANLYMSVALDKTRYQVGETVKAVINVKDDFNMPTVNWIEARIFGPTGDGIPVELNSDGGLQYHGEIPVQSKQVAQGENWYFQVMADLTINGSHTIRTASAVFSYVVPSAKIRSIYRPSLDQPLVLNAKVETLQASRYQLQGVIYATGDDGDVHSVALAQTSAWLDPGTKEMVLKFDKPLPSNLHEPYYLGQLELVDDAQLKPVYRYNEKIPLTQLDAE
ncbi:DUF4785 domain-containing protein [Legionella sp. W05-934-2]|jgi:hypothetical protein|uniref:DUF4785 domain-containing protein n=1 Tax=Legionella sp. W05-934-2 TaxID=1198649 RepID=UPI0034620D5A